MLASTVGSLVYQNSSDTFMQRSHSARCRWAEHHRSIAPHPKYLSPNISPFTSLNPKQANKLGVLPWLAVGSFLVYFLSPKPKQRFLLHRDRAKLANQKLGTEYLKLFSGWVAQSPQSQRQDNCQRLFEGCFHVWILTETCSASHDFPNNFGKLDDDYFIELNPTRDIDPCLWAVGHPDPCDVSVCVFDSTQKNVTRKNVWCK